MDTFLVGSGGRAAPKRIKVTRPLTSKMNFKWSRLTTGTKIRTNSLDPSSDQPEIKRERFNCDRISDYVRAVTAVKC